jgi:hypothetical protein
MKYRAWVETENKVRNDLHHLESLGIPAWSFLVNPEKYAPRLPFTSFLFRHYGLISNLYRKSIRESHGEDFENVVKTLTAAIVSIDVSAVLSCMARSASDPSL